MIIKKPYVLFQVGEIASGKTEHIKQHILPNVYRALVLDVNDEYHELPVLIPYILSDKEFLTNANVRGKYRVLLKGLSTKQLDSAFEYFSQTFINGTLVIEGTCFWYSRKRIELIRLLVRSDFAYKPNIIINLQNLNSLLDLSVYEDIKYINLFKCFSYINTKNPVHLYFQDMLTEAFKSLKTYRNVFIDVRQETTLCGEYRGVMQDQLIK